MPKETFGGDDEGDGGVEEKKKPELSKFGLSPDVNIRDVFWKIMGSYAATKKPGLDLSAMEHDRFALMRVAISVLSRPHSELYGLSPRFIASYTLMMMIDGGWDDTLIEFLERGSEEKLGMKKNIIFSIRKLLAQEEYKQLLEGHLTKMLRGRETVSVALSYVAEMNNAELVRAMKTELIILARGDIGQNQLNAISAISLIREDEEIRKSLVILLSHWDAEARLVAAKSLEGVKDDNVKKAVEKRLKIETDPRIKKVLKRLAK